MGDENFIVGYKYDGFPKGEFAIKEQSKTWIRPRDLFTTGNKGKNSPSKSCNLALIGMIDVKTRSLFKGLLFG